MTSIFQLSVIRIDDTPNKRFPYPKNIWISEHYNFTTLEDTEATITHLAKDNSDIYCFLAREQPIGRPFFQSETLTERVYLGNGQLHAERLFSTIRSNETVYHGRKMEEIQFKKYDHVEVLNLRDHTIESAQVMGIPPTPEWIEERRKRGFVPFLDDTDDCYTVIYGYHDLDRLTDEEYMKCHAHVSFLYLFPMPEKMLEKEKRHMAERSFAEQHGFDLKEFDYHVGVVNDEDDEDNQG